MVFGPGSRVLKKILVLCGLATRTPHVFYSICYFSTRLSFTRCDLIVRIRYQNTGGPPGDPCGSTLCQDTFLVPTKLNGPWSLFTIGLPFACGSLNPAPHCSASVRNLREATRRAAWRNGMFHAMRRRGLSMMLGLDDEHGRLHVVGHHDLGREGTHILR